MPTTPLLEAEGYLSLGMPKEALAALERVRPEEKLTVVVFTMRLVALQQVGDWAAGAELANGAVSIFPNEPNLYLLGAYHIRRAKSLREAHEFLAAGAHCCCSETGVWWFNLACYECQLGKMERVGELIKRATKLDPILRVAAAEDPDLKPWRELQS